MGDRIRLPAGVGLATEPILTPEALEFLATMARRFRPRCARLLWERKVLADLREPSGSGPTAEGRAIREADWTVPPAPPGLETRQVEIVGEPAARAIVRGLNSKADVFVADFDDLHAPMWGVTLHGQWNLARAVRRSLEYLAHHGERFRVVSRPATIMVRPRAWHVAEPGLTVDDRPVPAGLFDAGLYLFHNARELVRCGTGPYFYLSKLEHYPEAALWDEVFTFAEGSLGLARGTVRATAVIETVTAASEMDEILFALRPHSAGLAFHQLGLTFSQLKRSARSLGSPEPGDPVFSGGAEFLGDTARRVVRTSHRRGAPALNASPVHLLDLEIGGPSRPEIASELAEKVRDVRTGFDGCWVGNPAAVPVVRKFFEARSSAVALAISSGVSGDPVAGDYERVGSLVAPGFTPRTAVRASLRFLEARYRGAGSVVVDHVLQSESNVEVARTRLWLWTHPGSISGSTDPDRAAELRVILGEERAELRQEAATDPSRLLGVDSAARAVDRLTLGAEIVEYLTRDTESDATS
ncbi:MAG: hypothetical protein L3K19_00805 [Thermoplasmata archaeon]|nr:hypothetical protein [Thermoplasmata archaeon]